MSRFDLPSVDRITVGTEGPPGERVFYVQARQGPQVVSLKVEKAQVAALTERLGELLHDNPPSGPIPEAADLDLEQPVVAEWSVAQLGLSFATDADAVLLLFEEVARPDEGEVEPGPDVEGGIARFGCTRAQAAALAMRGAMLVASGRPPCPLCGYPLDPRGHACPRTNGHRAPRV